MAKYESMEEWLDKNYKEKGSTWWKDLRELCQLDIEEGGWRVNWAGYYVWESNWIGQVPLKISHNKVFLNSNKKE